MEQMLLNVKERSGIRAFGSNNTQRCDARTMSRGADALDDLLSVHAGE
jgi:hypothetical protein